MPAPKTAPISGLMELIHAFMQADNGRLTHDQAVDVLPQKGRLRAPLQFLLNEGFVLTSPTGAFWEAKLALGQLHGNLRDGAWNAARDMMRGDIYRASVDLSHYNPGEPLPKMSPIVQQMGDVLRLWASHKLTEYRTTYTPPLADFAELAIRRFDETAKGEQLALVGDWLHALILDGIHPCNARDWLHQAHAEGLLVRYLEGSTPYLKNKSHRPLNTLRVNENGVLEAEQTNLYHGDFLMDGKGATTLHIERP